MLQSDRASFFVFIIIIVSLVMPRSVSLTAAETEPAPSTKEEKPVDKPAEAAADKPAVPAPEKLTVAVLDFSSRDPSNPDLGRQIGESVTASLSAQEGFTLVDRQSMRQTIQEHELNLTGMVNTDQAIQVGKLVGARLIITGSAFTLGKQLTVSAKLIGTETSLVDAVAVKGDETSDLGELVDKLTEKITDRIGAVGSKLVARADGPDPLVALTKKLTGRKLPRVAIIVGEQYVGPALSVVIVERPRGEVADPPVQNELQQAALAAGFTVQDIPLVDLHRLSNGWNAELINTWPSSLGKVDFLIVGNSFSEFGARVGNLNSCSARAEINIVGRKTGKILLAKKATARAADLSEHMAAKTALEKAGHALAVDVLTYFAETTADSQPANGEAVKP